MRHGQDKKVDEWVEMDKKDVLFEGNAYRLTGNSRTMNDRLFHEATQEDGKTVWIAAGVLPRCGQNAEPLNQREQITQNIITFWKSLGITPLQLSIKCVEMAALSDDKLAQLADDVQAMVQVTQPGKEREL